MNKEVMLSLHTGGSFIVTFNDEKDYEIFKKERSKYIGMIIVVFVTFTLSVLSFILMFDYSIFIYFFRRNGDNNGLYKRKLGIN